MNNHTDTLEIIQIDQLSNILGGAETGIIPPGPVSTKAEQALALLGRVAKVAWNNVTDVYTLGALRR